MQHTMSSYRNTLQLSLQLALKLTASDCNTQTHQRGTKLIGAAAHYFIALRNTPQLAVEHTLQLTATLQHTRHTSAE